MVVVDSSVWIDYFNGTESKQTAMLDDIAGVRHIIVSDIILTEVLQGFKNDKDFKAARKRMEQCIVVSMLGSLMAIKSAKNYRKLRKKGLTIRSTIDVIIATFCIHNNLKLLHSDKDFDVIKKALGLKILG